ncbi:hypothetical protein BDV95DRAFT_573330 [Massariosphaeria phaeospora]|uniref:Rhodopsin domain-containing protein n=1 Tax=Massariosphaeria phaeospora TaxID=100035 RepID=A0A7C8MBB3_9PLEO|nr:hypothetical protein BDV95DRAFT_573330 [Massariosphaeria phaeospora]
MFYGAWSLIVLNGVYYTIGTALVIWACNPREKIWNPFIPGGRCLDSTAVFRTAASFNIFSDVSILILPSLSIWQLHVPFKKKVEIFLLLALGLL